MRIQRMVHVRWIDREGKQYPLVQAQLHITLEAIPSWSCWRWKGSAGPCLKRTAKFKPSIAWSKLICSWTASGIYAVLTLSFPLEKFYPDSDYPPPNILWWTHCKSPERIHSCVRYRSPLLFEPARTHPFFVWAWPHNQARLQNLWTHAQLSFTIHTTKGKFQNKNKLTIFKASANMRTNWTILR